jgi:hypothetical protein
LPKLALKLDFPHLCLQRSLDYRCGPLVHGLVSLFIFAVLGLDLRVSYLLGKCATTWPTPQSLVILIELAFLFLLLWLFQIFLVPYAFCDWFF